MYENDFIIFILLGLLFGSILGVITKSIIDSRNIKNAKNQAQKILDTATKENEKRRRETIIDTKQEIHSLKQEADRDIKSRSKIIAETENRLSKREERLDNRVANLDRRESTLDKKENQLDSKREELDKKNSKMDELLLLEEAKLVEISQTSVEEAKAQIMDRVEQEMGLEITAYIKEQESEARSIVDKKAQSLLANAINTLPTLTHLSSLSKLDQSTFW